MSLIWHTKRSPLLERVFDLLSILSDFSKLEVHVWYGCLPRGYQAPAQYTTGFFRSPNTIWLRETGDNREILTFLHELSHMLSYKERTPSFKTYDHKNAWLTIPEERKAQKEARLLAEIVLPLLKTKTPKIKKQRRLEKAQRVWKEYQQTHWERMANTTRKLAWYERV
jgi:hypothetical protein